MHDNETFLSNKIESFFTVIIHNRGYQELSGTQKHVPTTKSVLDPDSKTEQYNSAYISLKIIAPNEKKKKSESKTVFIISK